MSILSQLGDVVIPGHGAGVVGAALTVAMPGGAPLGAALAGDLGLARAIAGVYSVGLTLYAPPLAPLISVASVAQDAVLGALVRALYPGVA